MTEEIEPTYSVGEVSRILAVSVRRLQRWDEQNLARATGGSGRQRRYTERDLKRAKLVASLSLRYRGRRLRETVNLAMKAIG